MLIARVNAFLDRGADATTGPDGWGRLILPNGRELHVNPRDWQEALRRRAPGAS